MAASDWNDRRWAQSNHGGCVDIFAPGVGITSVNFSTGRYTLGSGTSAAAAHVSGTAALYLEDHPAAGPSQVHEVIVENDAYPTGVEDRRGSPNRLLYRPGDRPLITYFSCESYSNQVACSLTHDQTSTPTDIYWYRNGAYVPHWQDRLSIYDGCGSLTRILVYVLTDSGFTAARATVPCETNG